MDNNKQCDGCQVAANVPYAAFEAVSARAERNIRRLALIIVFLILALIGSNIAWLCYESQFEDVTSQTEQTVTQQSAIMTLLVERPPEAPYFSQAEHLLYANQGAGNYQQGGRQSAEHILFSFQARM